MAFIFKVEDGTGYPDATSYASVEYADEYISFFYPEDAQWTALSESDKEKKLMIATKFLDGAVRWQSSLKRDTQSLEWPRQEFTDLNGRIVKPDSAPQAIIDATVILAYSSLSSSLSTGSYSIIEERFGDTQDTYAAPVTISENGDVRAILKELSSLGYSQSRGAYVSVQRQ